MSAETSATKNCGTTIERLCRPRIVPPAGCLRCGRRPTSSVCERSGVRSDEGCWKGECDGEAGARWGEDEGRPWYDGCRRVVARNGGRSRSRAGKRGESREGDDGRGVEAVDEDEEEGGGESSSSRMHSMTSAKGTCAREEMQRQSARRLTADTEQSEDCGHKTHPAIDRPRHARQRDNRHRPLRSVDEERALHDDREPHEAGDPARARAERRERDSSPAREAGREGGVRGAEGCEEGEEGAGEERDERVEEEGERAEPRCRVGRGRRCGWRKRGVERFRDVGGAVTPLPHCSAHMDATKESETHL